MNSSAKHFSQFKVSLNDFKPLAGTPSEHFSAVVCEQDTSIFTMSGEFQCYVIIILPRPASVLHT